MKKRLVSMLLVLVMVLGMLPATALAASSEEEALGEVNIYNGEQKLSYAIFDNIKPGAYEIKEITAPSGWLRDDATYTASVATGETTIFSLVNKELPGLRIIKYDRKNMAAMANVTFEIFRDSVSLGKFRTDEFGEILLTDAAPGTYRAVEVDTGSDGHILDTTPQEVELSAGDGIKELLFFNDVKPGMRLIKVDSTDPSKVIPNAVFEIKSVKGDYGPQEFVTDQNGEIDLSKLPTGAYVVTEKACEGYIIDQAQRIIQLDPNEDAQFVFTNTIKPSLQIIKTSSDGSRLKNVHFRIAKIEDGTHYLDRTTNEQGEILIADLEPGVYSVRETATDSSHILDLREYHMELFPGKTSTLTVENQKRPNLTVYKHDADTGEPIANTVFEVRAADGHSVDQIKTDSEGKAELKNLLPGVYEISEKSVPSPYLLDAPAQLATLYPNRDHTVYFENHQKPALTVKKVDSVTGDPLQGAKFHVTYASNNTGSGEINDLGTYYTGENGQFQLTGLRDGWYKVTEQEPPTGYAIKEATQEVYIKSGTSKTLTFENIPLSALVVWKYDSVTGEAVSNAVFQVKYLGGTSGTGGTVIGTYKTSANGSFTVTGLKEGTYIVEELASDSGHVIDTAPQTAYISGKQQDVVQLYFGNSPKGSLLVKKIDSATHKPLSDVEFMVTTADGSVVGDANGKFVTDSAGTFTITDIVPGTTLVVKETRARDGYLLDDAPQAATVKAGQTVTLEFRNQPQGSLIINKLSSADKKTPLEGVLFQITYSDGSYADNGALSSKGLYRTDKNGQIILSGITGTVIVTEVETIKGYRIDDATRSQTIEVRANDTQQLWFYNAPTSRILLHKVDKATGKGIYGAVFLLYDSNHNPIGEHVTDQDGYIYADEGLADGRYYLREIKAAPGYVLDPELKTIYVRYGSTTEIEWSNTAECGQIQIIKKSADDNATNGLPAGIMSLYEQLMGSDKIEPQEKSIIDRSVGNIYREYIKNFQGQPPTLKDLYDDLMKQVNPEAHRIALALELFTVGSLNVFSHQTNINTKSRILCFDIQDLGENLKSVGLLVMLDAIYNRVIQNRKAGKYTHVYIDEIYLFFANGSGGGRSITNYSSEFLYKCWKRFRKYGATLTGITQNVEECLLSNTARMMFANSEFLLMLNPATTDREQLARLLGASDTQMSYVDNAPAGHGLIKVGGAIVPFANELPKNTELYRLMSTRPGED